MEGSYPTIDQVCQAAVKVFTAEAKGWRVRSLPDDFVINSTEVGSGRRSSGGVSRIAADCRAIVVHIIARHVPMHDCINKRDTLLTKRQIGLHMGGVRENAIWQILNRSCSMLERYEYQCMYYSTLKDLVEQGFDLLALPKNLYTEKRA